MNKSTYEQELDRHGKLIYTNVGTSMLPLLRQRRDLLIIEKKTADRCRKYDAILYKRPSGQYVLHRILKVRPEDYVLCGDNQWRREYGVTDDQILGTLTAVVRDGKELKSTDFNYRLYVHLWCDFYYIRAGILCLKDYWRAFKRKFFK